MAFWTYILRCSDGAYYTGHTENLEQRIGQHQLGQIAGFTSTRRPVELVFSQELNTREKRLLLSCRSSLGVGRRKRL